MNLEIKNIIVNGNKRTYYKVNLNFNENKIIGVLSNDEEAINDFFLKASGINKVKGEILFNGLTVFENKDYFLKRLLIDYSESYITTLDKSYLKKYFFDFFNLDLNLEVFEKINQDFRLRTEYLIKDRYLFTKRGLNLVNYSLTKSVNKNINFIKNTITYCKKEDREKIFLGLADKTSFDINFLDLSDTLVFSDKIDEYLIFTNAGEVVTLTNDDDIYIVGGEILNNLIYSKAFNFSLTNYNYNKEEIKVMKKNKIMIKKIKLLDMGKYI